MISVAVGKQTHLGKRETQLASDLDEDLLLELVWRWQPICCNIHWLCQQHVSKHLFKVCGHVSLLHDAAVVLNGQNDGVAIENERISFTNLLFHIMVVAV